MKELKISDIELIKTSMKKGMIIIAMMLFAIMASHAQSWYQAGFRISTQFPLVREYSNNDKLMNQKTVQFCGFFRAGKYVYGEIGLGYQYFRCRYNTLSLSGEEISDIVETRYLVLPFKAVGNVRINKNISFMPSVGILYQPLLKVTDNTIGYSKKNIENHWALFTTGFDWRFAFITLGVDYRLSMQKFFRDKEGRNPQYIGITVGAIF